MTWRDDRLSNILRANARDLLAYIERRTGHDDATDVLNEVMTVAWRRIEKFPADDDEARLWLFGVARMSIANARRSQRRRRLLVLRVRDSGRVESLSPEASAGLEVRDAVDRLDDDLAEVIRLVHWDGFSLAEASAVIGVPASTVRSRYGKAKEKLRESLSLPDVVDLPTEVG